MEIHSHFVVVTRVHVKWGTVHGLVHFNPKPGPHTHAHANVRSSSRDYPSPHSKTIQGQGLHVLTSESIWANWSKHLQEQWLCPSNCMCMHAWCASTFSSPTDRFAVPESSQSHFNLQHTFIRRLKSPNLFKMFTRHWKTRLAIEHTQCKG